MHEMAYADEIRQLVDQNRQGKKIVAVTVQTGKLAGIVPEALSFCLETTLQEAFGEQVVVTLNCVDGEALCACGTSFKVSEPFQACPNCQGYRKTITSGKDVFLKSFEIEDEDE